MSLQKDPERNEIRRLRRYIDLAGKQVLEIGAGEGRLTWQYARLPRSIVAMDLDHNSLRAAKVDRPFDLEGKVDFACAEAQSLPFPKEKFDIALLAWSL